MPTLSMAVAMNKAPHALTRGTPVTEVQHGSACEGSHQNPAGSLCLVQDSHRWTLVLLGTGVLVLFGAILVLFGAMFGICAENSVGYTGLC